MHLPSTLVVLLAFPVSGCTLAPEALDRATRTLDEAEAFSAEISSRMADRAAYRLCESINMSDWRRLFGSSPDRAAAYDVLCPAGENPDAPE